MLVTPVSQSVTPVSHFNYACISVFICNEEHSLEREREKRRTHKHTDYTTTTKKINTLRHIIIVFIIFVVIIIIINEQGLGAEEDSSTESIYLFIIIIINRDLGREKIAPLRAKPGKCIVLEKDMS